MFYRIMTDCDIGTEPPGIHSSHRKALSWPPQAHLRRKKSVWLRQIVHATLYHTIEGRVEGGPLEQCWLENLGLILGRSKQGEGMI